MRLVTWNCCRGPFARKVAALDSLHADVAVIQECPRPSEESDQCLWFGENPRQGIAVFSWGGYRLRRLPIAIDVPNFTIPIEITGPTNCVLLVVWAKPSRGFRYVEAVVRAVDLYSPIIAQSATLLIGDLNSNQIWDSSHSVTSNHSALVRKLSALGMVSCYHAYFDEEHGAETTPTFNLHRKQERPYHIDFCFAPVSWIPRLRSVQIGSFEEWKQLSDHRPVLFEFAPDAV